MPHCLSPEQGSNISAINVYGVVAGVRPYKCELCGVAFAQKNNLTRHMQVHGGRFQYKCSYDTCNFATRRYEVFKRHMMQHGSLPYQCRLCDKAYFFHKVIDSPFLLQCKYSLLKLYYKIQDDHWYGEHVNVVYI